jgi:hypothetical protein
MYSYIEGIPVEFYDAARDEAGESYVWYRSVTDDPTMYRIPEKDTTTKIELKNDLSSYKLSSAGEVAEKMKELIDKFNKNGDLSFEEEYRLADLDMNYEWITDKEYPIPEKLKKILIANDFYHESG